MNRPFDPHAQSSSEVPAETEERTPSEVKDASKELLRYGYIEEARKPALFRHAIARQSEISHTLEPLDFALRLDEHRGIAFLTVVESGDDDPSTELDTAWTHPLVRRQRLTLEQSLMVAILRQAFVMHEQETGIGGPPAKVAVEDLLPHFILYLEDSGSDAKNESRLSSLLDQLKTYGIVSEIDKNNEVTIRPLIAHLANPDSLNALLSTLKDKQAESQK